MLADGLDDAEGVVIVVGTHAETGPVTALDAGEWDHLVDATMWDTLTALQDGRTSFGQSGGRIVLVLPTIGLAGAAGLVAYSTAIEGIRAMAKSAARQWKSDGVTVNMVAAPVGMFAPELAADDSLFVGSVVESVRFLLRPDLEHLVGATLVVDGGAVMLP